MNEDNPSLPKQEEQLPGGNELPAPIVPSRGYTFEKTDNPKIKQFTGRATQAEYDRINEALERRKQDTGRHYDIVRWVLDAMDHLEADIFQSFKTKKKK